MHTTQVWLSVQVMQVHTALHGECLGSSGLCQHLTDLSMVCFIEVLLWSLAVCTSVCGVWGDPPTIPTGADSCHQFTDVHTSIVLYCCHLEGESPGGDSCHYVTDIHTSIVLYCCHFEGALSGGDSCHQFTDMHTHSTSPYCCHHLERFEHTYECHTIPTV